MITDSLASMTAVGEPTRLPSSAPEFGPLTVRIAPAAAASQPLEIRDLLLRRLRILTVLALSVNGVFNALRFLRLDFTPETIWWEMLPAALYLSAMGVLATLLRRKRVHSLSQLRVFEAVLFGLTTVYFVGETYTPLFGVEGWLLAYAQRHPQEMSILARQPSINWLTIIIAYGTFIPNTGRRCAIMTALIALTPLTTVAVAGWLHTQVPHRLLFLFLSEMTMWLGTAVALAIYGSHKITVLREEALAARKLGQYQLKQRLGQGGMGEVYLAEHTLLRRPCAVKVIRPEQMGDPRVLQRFLREVQMTATLTHPNTVQVFDYGQANDGTVFYAMEYLTGLNLDELVRMDGPLPASRAISVLRQLCGALAEAHAVGLIHRDIKPGNVILCNRGGLHDVVKLLDFGLARMQTMEKEGAGLTQAGLIFGTPSFMSPEQAAGKSTLDARSDIYSLGALAYFLLSGKPPFVRETVVQTLAAHCSDAPAPLRGADRDVPGDLESVVLRCLAKEPGARFADTTHVEHALAACHSARDWTPTDATAWWERMSTRPTASAITDQRVSL